MAARKRFSLGRVPLGRIVILAALATSVLVFFTVGTTHGQTPVPTISNVDPAPPYCVLQHSTEDTDLLLTITGEDLTAYENDGRVQFLDTDAQQETRLFDRNINWQDPRRISVDMSDVDLRFNSDRQLRLRVRVISDESERLSSEWSDEFIFARSRSACGTDSRFPPTSPIRGLEGDLWADVVIGKPDFSQTGPLSVVPFKVFGPGGVVVDRSEGAGRAYIWDSGNSRILGIDLADCYETESPCSADIVIGQPSGFDHSACNGDSGLQGFPYRAVASAETLCGIRDVALSPSETHNFVTMAVDGRGSLYVPDSVNHRILKYEDPFETDSVADQVWGQVDFTGMACNRGSLGRPTAETLCFHSPSNQRRTNWYGNGVEIDKQGNMWVADGGNNRVLRFPVNPDTGEIASAADLVLGQRNLRSAEERDGFTGLHGPSAVRVGDNGWVYVADTINDRIQIFKPPFRSGMQADAEFGSGFDRPTSLELDPLGRGVWVVDGANYMVQLWDKAGDSVLQVLGRDSYMPDGRCGEPLFELPGSPHLCPVAGSVGIDAEGNVLVPVYLITADVFRFPALTAEDGDAETKPVGQADKRLFYPPFDANFQDRNGLHSPRGIAIWQDQLVVADRHRLLFWNGLDSLSDGRPADGLIGDEFQVGSWHYCCGRLKVDTAGRLWVLGFEGRYFLEVYQLPLTELSVPLHTTWRRSASFPVLGTTERTALGDRVFGIAVEGPGDYLWLSDTDNHHVLRIRDPLTNPMVDVVLGQQDATTTLCNQGRFQEDDRNEIGDGGHRDVLCYPGGLSIDKQGNLYVSDHALEVSGNKRLLVFPPSSINSVNSKAVFAPNADSVFTLSATGFTHLSIGHSFEDREVIGKSGHHLFTAATWEPAFDSTNRMVVGYNAYFGPRFVGVYDDPLDSTDLPTSYLYDFGSMPYTATFDDKDNLYVGDINRGRLLIYKNPFSNTPPEEPALADTAEAPIPSYPVSIQSVNPGPPYCVMRDSTWDYETTLEFDIEGLADTRDLTLEIRKSTSHHRVFLDLGPEYFQEGNSSIRLDHLHRNRWQGSWSRIGKVTLTARLLTGGWYGTPISNWSPAFLLADDAATCGIALPTPTPIPTPTPTETPTPLPSPTPIPANTATPTVTPTLVPSPTPTQVATATVLAETPEPPTPTPLITPTATPESTSVVNVGPFLLPLVIVSILLSLVGFLIWRRRR